MEKEFSQSSDSSTEIEENQKSKPLVFGIVSKMSASASRLLGALKGKVRVTGIENNVKVNNDLIESALKIQRNNIENLMLENVPRSKLDAIIVKETPVNQHDTKSLTKKVVNKARITTKIEVKSALPVVQEIKPSIEDIRNRELEEAQEKENEKFREWKSSFWKDVANHQQQEVKRYNEYKRESHFARHKQNTEIVSYDTWCVNQQHMKQKSTYPSQSNCNLFTGVGDEVRGKDYMEGDGDGNQDENDNECDDDDDDWEVHHYDDSSDHDGEFSTEGISSVELVRKMKRCVQLQQAKCHREERKRNISQQSVVGSDSGALSSMPISNPLYVRSVDSSTQSEGNDNEKKRDIRGEYSRYQYQCGDCDDGDVDIIDCGGGNGTENGTENDTGVHSYDNYDGDYNDEADEGGEVEVVRGGGLVARSAGVSAGHIKTSSTQRVGNQQTVHLPVKKVSLLLSQYNRERKAGTACRNTPVKQCPSHYMNNADDRKYALGDGSSDNNFQRSQSDNVLVVSSDRQQDGVKKEILCMEEDIANIQQLAGRMEKSIKNIDDSICKITQLCVTSDREGAKNGATRKKASGPSGGAVLGPGGGGEVGVPDGEDHLETGVAENDGEKLRSSLSAAMRRRDEMQENLLSLKQSLASNMHQLETLRKKSTQRNK